jgi:nitrogen fixation/metabolism regulation signal transduction histidine kinase
MTALYEHGADSDVTDAVESPRDRPDTVFLFMQEGENRALLAEWLGRRYRVTVGSTPTRLDQEFDLCLVDEVTFARHTDALIDRKERVSPTFLPYLLVLTERAPSTLDKHVWELVDEVIATPITKDELRGRLVGLLVRRSLSLALSEQEERLRQILQTIPDPLLIVDDEGTVVETNAAFRDYTDCDDQVVGTGVEDLRAFPSATADVLTQFATGDPATAVDDQCGRPTDNGRRTAETPQSTLEYRRGDGTIRNAEVGVASLTGVGDATRQTLFLLRDVTDRIEREQALEHERDRLDNFADMLAHEVRNPLNIAQGHLGLLTPNDADDAETIDRVATAHTRIEQIVGELLEHARGREPGPAQSVNLAQIARDTWDRTSTADATLELASEEAVVEADPKSLRTVLGNLVRNAVEHGGSTVAVRVGPIDCGGFYLEDDGPGVPGEEYEHIFELGYTTTPAGTGLGLALVKQIADEHGWEIVATGGDLGGVRIEFHT